jgi:hypothetical protein
MKVASTVWIRMALAGSIISALFALSTFGQIPFTGELLVSGNNVTVNGEQAVNGRTIFVPSTITTGPNSYATLNFGNAGKIQLAPNTTFSVDGSAAGLRGSLPVGSVTVLSTATPVSVTTLSGRTVSAGSGEVVLADAGAAPGGGSSPKSGVNPVLYLVVAAAAVGLLVGVAGGGGGGGGNTGGGPVSPIV